MAKKKVETEQMALIETKEENPIVNVEEVKNEIKKELKAYFEDYNERRLLEELDKSNRRLIKEKNHKIIFRDIIILLLIGFILFAGYVMYRKKVLDFLLNRNTSTETVKKEENKKEEEKKEPEVKEVTLEDLKKEYGYLLDNYNLGMNSSYLKDFYNGKLTSEIKKEMTLNKVFNEIITNEEDYSVIDEEAYKKEFNKLFIDGYNKESFNYNDNRIRFISKFDEYMSDTLLKKDTVISKEITDIKLDNQKIMITTSEIANNEKKQITYIFEDEKLYDIRTS